MERGTQSTVCTLTDKVDWNNICLSFIGVKFKLKSPPTIINGWENVCSFSKNSVRNVIWPESKGTGHVVTFQENKPAMWINIKRFKDKRVYSKIATLAFPKESEDI